VSGKLTVTVDMNGIVHPCTHPEGKPAPETEEEMMVEIFKYTERVVNMARPRKVLMMAIGGSYIYIFRLQSLSDMTFSRAKAHHRRRCRTQSQDESTKISSFPCCSRGKGQGD
jgi:5'-3' exonuclease